MIFIIEPEIDFVTITVVVGSLYQKKWHIIGTAFSPIRRFFIIFLLQDPNLIFFLDVGCSFIQFSFESHSIYLHALYRFNVFSNWKISWSHIPKCVIGIYFRPLNRKYRKGSNNPEHSARWVAMPFHSITHIHALALRIKSTSLL